jgi:hypothetical protein
MNLQTKNLPYHYETGSDPITLTNSVTKQDAWHYSLRHYDPAKPTPNETVLLIERLYLRRVYALDDKRIIAARVHEWQYTLTHNESATFHDAVRGYRVYDDGQVMRGEAHILQPEVAVILGYTPDATLPPYIETAPAEALRELLTEAEALIADESTVNAWLPVPVAAPDAAPEDVFQAMRQMRGEIGIRATRGRSRMLTRVMEAAGVTLAENGWALTDEEHTRRKQEPIS